MVFVVMHDQRQWRIFQLIEIKLGADGPKTHSFCRFTQLKQTATFPCRLRNIPDLLQGNQFAIVLGDNPKACRPTVLGVGLVVERESGFQKP